MFSQNRDAEPSPVKGSNSTLANTDTSAAKTLPPARDAASREEKAASQEASSDKSSSGKPASSSTASGRSSNADPTKELPQVSPAEYGTLDENTNPSKSSGNYENANATSNKSGGDTSVDPIKELPKVSPAEYGTLDENTDAASGSAQSSKSSGVDKNANATSNKSGGDTSVDPSKELPKVSPAEYGTLDENSQPSKSSGNDNDGNANSNESGGGAPVDPAPTYVTSVTSAGQTKPKGKNLTEGGFDDDPKNNASFNSDIGTENDPGKAAELQFQKQQAATVGSGPRQSGITGDGQYDILETDQQL